MSWPNGELLELARAKWKSSGLSDEQAAALKFEILEREEVPTLGPNFHRARGLKIPYFNDKGETTEFFRLRYLEPLPGFAAQVKKPQKYVQPAGTLNEVYLPPIINWQEVIAEPKTPIFITEGELKAAAGCSLGLAVVGLGGVDVWRSSRRGIELLPQLEAIAWNKRPVVIVYDSDAATNPNVVRAQRQLAKELLSRGAIPQIASIPATPSGGKQGLDDFLVSQGPEALLNVLAAAPAFPEAEALWELNEEVVYVADPGLIIVRDTRQKLSCSNFTQHAFANRHYLETETNKKGVSKTTKKPLAKRWIDWEQRFQVRKISYLPGQAPFVDDQWNEWRGWGVQPKEGDIGPWESLMDFIFKGQVEARQWFERWLAYPLQHPGTKLYSSAVIWGVVHGTGKTLVAYTMRRIYGDNFAEIKSKQLRGGFNEWAENKQFVYGDEITGSDRRMDADQIKGMITQEFLRINAKYVPSYEIPDCVNYYFSSNHPDAFFLEDTDRRFFVHELVGGPASPEFYRRYDRWLRGDGPAFLFQHLLNLDLGDFDPRAHALDTTSKQAMILDNKSDLGAWVATLKEDAPSALMHLGEKVANHCELLTPELLFRAYDPDKTTKVTKNGMARELKRSGIRQINETKPIRTALGLVRLYAIRNAEQWEKAEPGKCAEHFNSFFDGKGGKF